MATKRTKREKSTNTDSHYVDQHALKDALVEYYEKCKEAEAAGKEDPVVSNFIGECFLRMAKKISNHYYFRNYSYVDDMVAEAVIRCLQKIKKFDPTRGTSAFSYFTSVIWFSYYGTIAAERKITHAKNRAFLMGDLESFMLEIQDENLSLNFQNFVNNLPVGTQPLVKAKQKTSPEMLRLKKFNNTPSPLEPQDFVEEPVIELAEDFEEDEEAEEAEEVKQELQKTKKVKDPYDDGPAEPEDIFSIRT